jgi:hypothetical protein
MTARPTLAEIRAAILAQLDEDDWVTPSELGDRLGLGHGNDWYKLALVLERLANDGVAELKHPGRTRRFRLGRPAA